MSNRRTLALAAVASLATLGLVGGATTSSSADASGGGPEGLTIEERYDVARVELGGDLHVRAEPEVYQLPTARAASELFGQPRLGHPRPTRRP